MIIKIWTNINLPNPGDVFEKDWVKCKFIWLHPFGIVTGIWYKEKDKNEKYVVYPLDHVSSIFGNTKEPYLYRYRCTWLSRTELYIGWYKYYIGATFLQRCLDIPTKKTRITQSKKQTDINDYKSFDYVLANIGNEVLTQVNKYDITTLIQS